MRNRPPTSGGSAKRGKGDIDPLVKRVLDGLNLAVEAKGTTVTAVARAIEMDQGNLSRVMAGGVPQVSFLIIAKVAIHLNVSLDDLLIGPRPMYSPERRSSTPIPSSSVLPSRPR